ncbi:MAG TPA: hypothetical protein VGO58_06340 [Chitinophagaceae bacterium]|jgi:hypothetical protein|nr:hypothetical protein [Chitinophagaceae bacterium]
MSSQTFYCPHCKKQLTKSAQAYVLGEAYAHQTTTFIMGSPPADVHCPGCGGRIDSMRMIKGEYDGGRDQEADKYSGYYVVGMIIMPFIFRFAFHWSWVASILVGLFAGVVAVQLILEIMKPGNKR